MTAQPALFGRPETSGTDVMPRHIGIIMDGNGRWASRNGLPRSVGHERGVEALRRTVRAGQKMGLEYLTVYSFSTENWRRPVSEVTALFGLLRTFIKQDLKRLNSEGVKIDVFGTRHGLPDDISQLLDLAVSETSSNDKFRLGIAFNYGGREEIVRAAALIAQKVQAGEMTVEQIDEQTFSDALDTRTYPDPDLIIRTGEERRLSNFLVWQSAYSELYFTEVLWPEFGEEQLRDALLAFTTRERRFGGLKSGAA